MCSLSRILKFSVLLPALAFSNFSFAQKYFQPGHIINLKGDTIKGQIEYRNWESVPDKIKFISAGDDKEIVCTPKNIKGFEVSGEKYESAAVKTEVSGDNINSLSRAAELYFEADTTFLQAIVTGPKNLYHYRNKVGKDQFYIKKNSDFTLLVYKRYQSEKDGAPLTISENRGYLNQLNNYFEDCTSLKSKLENTKYTTRGLSEVFEDYYKCTGVAKEFSMKKEKIVIATGAIAGISYTTLGVSYVYADNYNFEVNFNASLNVAAGLYADIILPRNMGRWSIYNELLYSSYAVESELYNAQDGIASVGYTYLKLNNMLRYKFPVGSSFVFLNAGLSNGYAIKEINKVDFGSGQTHSFMGVTRLYEQGLLFGAGAMYHRISVEARVEIGNGMSASDYYSTPTTRMFLLLGYRF